MTSTAYDPAPVAGDGGRETDLLHALRRAGVDDVRTDTTTRAVYSTDASLYRVVPRAVVMPRDADDVAATLEVCRETGTPLTTRGGGTSIAGNAVSTGVVVDMSRHMNHVLELDPESRTAVVQPGTVHATLQKAALAAGLRFGPDPSSHTRCTVGGMIGNNACGSRALAYGRTSDNVMAQRLLLADGTTTTVTHGERTTGVRQLDAAAAVVADDLATVRTEFARFGRQVSGYSLEHLLPENDVDHARFLVGSEGTLAITTEATVRLVTEPALRTLVVLGYPDIYTAGDAAPVIRAHHPVACEGMDRRITDTVRERRGPSAVPDLPRGDAWLFVEVAGGNEDEVSFRVQRLLSDAGHFDHAVVHDTAQAATLWRLREDGAGLSGRSPAGRPAHSGWEDAAVPPEQLGDYLRDLDALFAEMDLTGIPYGHFGDGCMHIRIDFPLDRPGGTERFGTFLQAAAELVGRSGGSMSGEHGDGRARSQYLSQMYSPAALDLFAAVKHAYDPDNLLNPGVLVDPAPATSDLRVPGARRPRGRLALAYHGDDGDFRQAVHRCTGVGKCRADNTATGGVMCPSYLATREEKDSTRGRARALQEMLNGSLVSGGWRSPEVHKALDLCLSCKGCASDCPTGVDMASYKAEVLHQAYKRRLRPVAHYTLGRLPRWMRLASRAPRLANASMALAERFPALLRLAGVDERRHVPRVATQTFRAWFAEHEAPDPAAPPVVLFVDTFTDHFSPEVGQAAVRVLEDAGYRVAVTDEQVCCGLTWISTGQLDTARRLLGRTVDALLPYLDEGVPVVGLEPSCTAVLRSETRELVDTPDAARVADGTLTLAELLRRTPGWTPPDLSGRTVVAQPHCHHHAVMGWSEDAALLADAGAEVERLGGCCGLAGNFGVEAGHYDVSVAVAEQALLPAVERADATTPVLADGFSCRTQLADLTDRTGRHLAQLLDTRKGGNRRRL